MPPIDVTIYVPPARLADDDRKRKGDGAPGTAVITKTRPQTKRPNLYRVLLLNDDYTPMEFVVHVLERFFNKDHGSAHRIMMHVHQHGIGECGIYTYEVAETKVTQVMDFARKRGRIVQYKHEQGKCLLFRAALNSRFIGRLRSLTSVTTNTRRSSTCFWR